MRAYAAQGHFKAGSMGPKVEACLRFAEAGGEAVIASLTEVEEAMAGKAGTHILPDAAAKAQPASRARARAAAKKPAPARQPAAGKPAAKKPAPKARRPRKGDAEVIDIASRRRAVSE
jgi:hypothetical protein